jgi:uncharacterized RDD family membrane protein YckC
MSAPVGYDTQIELITPENIAFHYRIAGPFRRLPAYLIDLLIRGAVMMGAFMGLSFVFGYALSSMYTALGISAVLFYLLDWFYAAVFEAWWNGQTPGKRLLQIRVVSADGQPIMPWQAILRNFLRALDGAPFVGPLPTYLVGLVSSAVSGRFQRQGDVWAGTVVVVEEPQRLYGVVRVTEAEVLDLARQIPGDFQVSRSLARALSDYVVRRKGFGWSRRAEIAAHLGEPLRERFDLPRGTSHDLILCALYHRVFLSDTEDRPLDAVIVEDDRPAQSPVGSWSR